MENLIVPLMIRFKRPSQDNGGDFRYDDAAQLNVSSDGGEHMPAVFVPGALADMKTLRRSQGGGED